LALLAVALIAGCGSSAAPESVSVSPVAPLPSGATEVTAAPAPVNTDCDREASLRPGPLPPPGDMPPGSPMAKIAERGRLIAGVDQNTFLFGFRNPATGELEGFDIDIAREIARAIFGDPNRILLRVVDASQRESMLQDGKVDVVVRTYSITCDR
jgi:polar amino acid transport system substrate-binding protein